jgi:hypothetical protein
MVFSGKASRRSFVSDARWRSTETGTRKTGTKLAHEFTWQFKGK